MCNSYSARAFISTAANVKHWISITKFFKCGNAPCAVCLPKDGEFMKTRNDITVLVWKSDIHSESYIHYAKEATEMFLHLTAALHVRKQTAASVYRYR